MSWLEFPGLGRPIIESLLGTLGFAEVFLDEGNHLIYLRSHVLYVLNDRSLWGCILFPGLSGDIQEFAGLSSKE